MCHLFMVLKSWANMSSCSLLKILIVMGLNGRNVLNIKNET